MRTFALTLAQNLGNGQLGATLDVTSKRVELGASRWEVDKELTKLASGDLSLKLADPDGSVWQWLQTQIQSSDGLLPPFLVVDIDGERDFSGTIDPSQMTVTEKTGEIALTAQGWSLQLAAKYLGPERPEDDWDPARNPWLRPFPKAAGHEATRPPAVGGMCHARYMRRAPGVTVITASIVCFEAPANWLEVGDLLDGTTTKGSFVGRKVMEIWRDHSAPSSNHPTYTCWARVEGDLWHLNSDWQSGTFQRQIRETESTTYYVVQKAVGHDDNAPCHRLPLDTVDGIVPGDQLRLVQNTKSQSWTALQVDAGACEVITREEVRDLAVGDRVFFTEESLGELVFEDARAILAKAANPFDVDMSRYTPPTLPVPVLTWLPLRPLTGKDLTSIKDLDSGFASLRVFGSGTLAWDGTPETGWQTATGTLPRAHWTDQRTVAPASLMPDETTTLTPRMPQRNRSTDLRWRRWTGWLEVNGRSAPDPLDSWDPGTADVPDANGILVYDYQLMRRIQIGAMVTITPWTGTEWGAATQVGWPVAEPCLSASVFPGRAGEVLALTSAGLRAVALPSASVSMLRPIPDEAKDAVLKTTPWGAYLVGSKGYGKILYTGPGQLSLDWVNLADELSTLYPGTFAGLSETECVALGRFEVLDKEGKPLTETYCLRLASAPTTPLASVLWREKILEGSPITLGAIRDPSHAERVVGHCGGRLFQVSRHLPVAYALERFKPSGMSAGELIEHVCEVLHAVPAPNASGVLQVISRSSLEAPVDLTVSNLSVRETRTWEHYYSYVRVSGEQEDIYSDVPAPGETATQGGKLLEVSNHPLIWTLSGCEAMARAMHAFFSVPRRIQTQTWVWPDPDTPAPWESLLPLTRLRLNGAPTVWMLMGLEAAKTKGEAKATLLEVV